MPELQPDFRAALGDLQARLQHVETLSAFDQVRHLWPTVWQLVDALQAMGEDLETIRNRIESEGYE